MIPIHSPVARPPWSQLGRTLESATRKALHDFALLDGVTHLAIALSGGKDSLTLLFLLHAIAGRGFAPIKLTAIHVDGAFSCGAGVSKGYVEAICRELDVPLLLRSSTRTLEQLECYSCSRERRSLLFSAAKEAGCEAVAFGHHRDDNAETLLLNLLHKGEFAGMLPKVPMHDYGITIIRPLIYVDEASIVTFARQHGFARVTCQCPVGQRSKRKTTDELLDRMEECFPNARANIASASLLYGSQKAAAN